MTALKFFSCDGLPIARLSFPDLQRGILWLCIASSWLVVIEPAPYDYLFVIMAGVCLCARPRIPVALLPLLLFLLLFNLGGILSLLQVVNDGDAVKFTATSLLLAISAATYAILLADEPLERTNILRNAYVAAGVVAALLGLAGYFDIAGMAAVWAPEDRAQGMFKDPNVLSTFLIPPLCFLIQGFLNRSHARPLVSAGALLLIAGGIFFAFSRGAWVNAAACVLLLTLATFLLTPSNVLRSRIVMLALAGTLLTAAAIGFALSFRHIGELFHERAHLLNYYDSGETGRFGNQLNSIPLLLTMPDGMGPYQFRTYFTNDPHNVFLNAFASYGWLGGFSFLLLVIATFWIGWRTITIASPWRHNALAVYCPLLTTLLQSVQIDTDHWRHLYLLIGMMWGYFGATSAPSIAGERI